MTAKSTPPLHVLRSILRQIKSSHAQRNNATSISTTNPINNQNKSSYRDSVLYSQVIEQYRREQNAVSERAQELRKMAYDYHILKRDLRERARLYELDGGAETKLSPKELSRRAAARAGLQLPETN